MNFWFEKDFPRIPNSLFPVIGALMGTILGWVLNEVTSRRREKGANRKLILRTRTMIDLEIRQNIAILSQFFQAIEEIRKNEIESPAHDDRREIRLIERFLVMPAPSLSHKMWESQLPNLAMALDRDEIVEVNNFHHQLTRISEILDRLLFLQHQQIEEQQSRPMITMTLITMPFLLTGKFDWDAPILWRECESILNAILKKGNPIKMA